MTTSVTSRYSPAEIAQVDKERGSQSRPAYQKEKTLKQSPPEPVELWASHMGVNAGPIPSNKAIVATASLGVGWIGCSPERGWLTPDALAQLVKSCHDSGLKVHMSVQEPGHDYLSVVANPIPFAQYAASLVDAGVDAIGVGNEWNNPQFWKPSIDSSMVGPAKIHDATVITIRSKSMTIPVYTVGWSPGGGVLAPATCQANLMKWLTTASAFTGASHHPYCYDGPLGWGLPAHPEWNSFQQIDEVYAAAKAKGLAGGISLGEYGCPSAGTEESYPNTTFTEEKQAQCLADYYTGMAQFREQGIPIDYLGLSTAIDGDASTRPIESSMGVYRLDGTEKPSAQIVRLQAKKVW